MFGCNLYAQREGHLALVNVLPGKEGKAGVTVPNATFGGYAGEGHQQTDFSNAISSDGSKIFWTDTQEGEDFDHVFVLENNTTEVPVSGSGPAEFWTATPDGRFAYYTEAGQLWRFDSTTNKSEALTPSGAEVQGVIATNQTGEDGAYVYFVADGVLAAGAQPGEPNLYLTHGATTTLIGTLSPRDTELNASVGGAYVQASAWAANAGERLAEASPDGTHLVFESTNNLTGYATEMPEVFLYSAPNAKLVCASCSPTGAPTEPLNVTIPAERVTEERLTKLPVSRPDNTHMTRWLSENGNRVFFDSSQHLVPQDSNEAQDVYEWEREGEGGCLPSKPARRQEGCVYLLSGASDDNPAYLIGADASGENVFLEHLGPLDSEGVAGKNRAL